MATDHFHYQFNASLPSGARLRNALSAAEIGRDNIIKELATMTADLTGDGTLPAHFANVTVRYGFGNDEYAMAAYGEIQSCVFKTTTDEPVDHVDAALKQLFTRLR